MKTTNQIICIVVSAVLLFSCGKKSDTGKLIPANAAAVIVLNTKSMGSKMNLEELKQGKIFEKINQDTADNKLIKAIVDNPENTGINLSENLVGFYTIDSLGSYFTVTGNLSDNDKFEKFFSSTIEGVVPSSKEKIDYLVKDMYTIAWKDNRFYIITDMPTSNSTANTNWADTNHLEGVASYRNGISSAAALFNLKEKNSLEENEPLNDVLSKNSDVYFWMNLNVIQSQNIGMGRMSMLNMSKLMKDSYYTGTANFEEGKIAFDIASFSGKELSDIWSKYEGDNIDETLLNRSPVNKVAFTMLLNFQPEGLRALLDVTGMEGMANMALSQVGITVDDFIRANKGNLFVSIGDLEKDSMGVLKPKGIFVTGIGDKTSFNKLVDVAKRNLGKMVGSDYEYAQDDSYFSLGTSGYAAAFIAGKANHKDAMADMIKGGPAGGYADLQYILANTKSKTAFSAGSDSLNITFWKNIIFKGGNYSEGALRQHVDINLMDGKTNSLKQLNKYVNNMAVITEKQKTTEMPLRWPVDTTGMQAPVVR